MNTFDISVCIFLRNFAKLVEERYLTPEKRIEMHMVLSEYFSGQWSQGQLKPIHLPSLKTQLNTDRKVIINTNMLELNLASQ